MKFDIEKDIKVYIYKTVFTDGRSDFYDVIASDDEDTAYNAAEQAVKQIDDHEYGVDNNASIAWWGESATSLQSICDTTVYL